MFDGEAGCGGTGGDTELGVDRSQVAIHGTAREEEPFSDFCVSESIGDQT